MVTPLRSPILHRAARRPARRGARRRLALAALAALPLLTVAPRAEARTPESYEACMRVVDNLTQQCLHAADDWFEKYGCKWAGGVGIIACATAEAIEILAKGIALPRFQI
jgi:hypothetical protein